MTHRHPSRPNPNLHRCHVREDVAEILLPAEPIQFQSVPRSCEGACRDVLLQKGLGPTGWYHYLKGLALNHLLHAGRDRELLEDITAARDALDTLIRDLDPLETVQ